MRVAVIPARGEGSRVRAVRPDGNKLLLDVAGRTVLDRQLEYLRDFDLVLVLSLPKHLPDLAVAVGHRANVTLTGEREREPDGAALSMRMAIEHLAHLARETPVTFWFSDTLLVPGSDVRGMTRVGDVAVSLVSDGSRFLNVTIDDEGWVVDWQDHPTSNAAAWASIGVYTLTLDEWRHVLNGPDWTPGTYRFMRGATVRAVRTDRWLDVGTEASWRATDARLRAIEAPR